MRFWPSARPSGKGGEPRGQGSLHLRHARLAPENPRFNRGIDAAHFVPELLPRLGGHLPSTRRAWPARGTPPLPAASPVSPAN